MALACSGLALGAGCTAETLQEQAASEEFTIQIRFHEGAEQRPQQLFSLLPVLAPIEYTDVTSILVDVSYADTDQPVAVDFALTQGAPNQWQGTLPFLPRDRQLRFAARAFDADDTIIFSGDTLATLTATGQNVEIPLASAQEDGTFDIPRMARIAYPSEITTGQEVQVLFTVEGNTGEDIAYEITSADGSTRFLPADGVVSLTSTVADFYSLYAAPEVTEATDFDHEIRLVSDEALSSTVIITNFSTRVVPRTSGDGAIDTSMSVQFNPVILSLAANGTAIPDAVELTAAVSDDGDPALLTYQWSYTPNEGTPTATFANSGQGNPAIFQGYTVSHQGTITLQVTDENGGTTTLHYDLAPSQFADAIDHDSAVEPTRDNIVAGYAHTCVLTEAGQVRCWGDNQYGQLGYGNIVNVGDAADRLPYTAGDVPLPEPATQITAGNYHTCALLESGFISCWGHNGSGQLGYGRTDHLGDDEPISSFGYVSLGGLAVQIAAGHYHTCAIMESGFLRCWGHNSYGQLGYGNTQRIGDDEYVYSVNPIDLGSPVQELALGTYHTCALLASGGVRCWGRNRNGQLGYGHTSRIGDDEGLGAVPAVDIGGRARKLIAGGYHTCALLETGAMRCWGRNDHGQLGYGHTTNIGDNEAPISAGSIDISGLVKDITAGGIHTCALLTDGQLKCWGYGGHGRLGYGNTADQLLPPASGVDLGDASISRITAEPNHTCTLFDTGAARCWGAGGSGRLGYGNTSNVYSPADVTDIAIFSP